MASNVFVFAGVIKKCPEIYRDYTKHCIRDTILLHKLTDYGPSSWIAMKFFCKSHFKLILANIQIYLVSNAIC